MAEKKQDDGDRSGGDYEDKGETTINRVSVRVPSFYPTRPSLWFASLESQFVLAKITQDDTKYHYAISQLEASYADIVEDVIMAPPAADKYQRLKTELIKQLTASRERQVKQLLNHEELGDRKPSQFLRHLKHLAGPGVPDDFIRTVWTSRLPSSVQTIIAFQSKSTLEEVSELADQIMDVVTPSQQITAVSANPGATSESNQIAALTRQVQALAAKLDRMSRTRNRRTTHQRNNLSSTRSQSNYRKFPYCWYHAKFGTEARRCVKPCDFAGKGAGSR